MGLSGRRAVRRPGRGTRGEHPLRLEASRDGAPLVEVGETVLAGPTCDSIDVLFRKNRYRLPLDLRPGDRLRFQSAGAYTTTYSSVGFNGFAPLREVYR